MTNFKILLVGAEGIALTRLKCNLENMGHKVVLIAFQGEEVVKKVMELMPDLILVDLISGEKISASNLISKLKELQIPTIFLDSNFKELGIPKNKFKEQSDSIKSGDVNELRQAIELAVYKSTWKKTYPEELIKNSLHLKKALELGGIGSWDWDIENEILTCSEQLYKILGFEENFQPTFENIEALIHPDDLPKYKEKQKELLSKGGKSRDDLRIIIDDGKIRNIQQSIEVLCDDEGIATHVYGVMQDITELEKSRKKLTESEKKYRDIFENAMEGIFQTTPEGVLLSANPAFAHIYGFNSPEEMMENITNIQEQLYTHPEDRDEFKRILKRDGGVKNFEAEFSRPDGDKIWVLINSNAVKDEYGRIKYYEGTVIDITQLNNTEKILIASEDKYRSVIEQSYNGVLLADDQGMIIEWNRSMERITGINREEVYGKHLFKIVSNSLHPDLLDQLSFSVKDVVGTIFKTRKIPPAFEKLEYAFQRPDGQEKNIEAVNFPIKSGEKFFLCTIIRDISRQKIAEEQTKENLQKLIILNKIISIANHATNLQNLLKDVLNSTMDLLGFESGGIYLLDENKEYAVLQHYENIPHEFREKVKLLNINEEPYSQIHQEGKPLFDLEIDSELMKLSGFKAGAGIPLFSAGEIIGSISIGSRVKTFFTGLEMDILESIGMETGTVIAKMYSEAAIRDSLAEKEVLIREIHHRVKNNMQIISSLLNLQLQNVQEEETKNVLTESQVRVKTMAMVHEKLYQSPNMTRIQFKDYVEKLAYEIFYSYRAGNDIILEMDIEDIQMGIETAIPCGLIINELVTNSVKYAFTTGKWALNDKGTIKIQLKGQEQMELVIRDNGIGLPPHIDPYHAETLGLQLVVSLVKQLEGDLKIRRGPGTYYSITFQELVYKERI